MTSFLRPSGGPEHVLGIDRPAVRQNVPAFLPPDPCAPGRPARREPTGGPAEDADALGSRTKTRSFRCRDDAHGKQSIGELAGVEDPPLRQRNELQRNRRPSLAPESGEHPDDDVERPRAAVDRHDVGALPQPQRRKQTGNAEHVVEMAMRQQEPVEPSEASAAPQQLALRTLSAVDQDAVAPGLHEKARMVAVADGTLAEVPRNVRANILAAWRLSYLSYCWTTFTHSFSSDKWALRQADFRCGLAAGFFAAASFAGFLPAIGISISFWPAGGLARLLGRLLRRLGSAARRRRSCAARPSDRRRSRRAGAPSA